jgi:hypothetical protein
MIARLRCWIAFCVLLLPVLVRAQGVTTGPIDEALGRSGQKTGDVYKVSFPRSDSFPCTESRSSRVSRLARGRRFSEPTTMPW